MSLQDLLFLGPFFAFRFQNLFSTFVNSRLWLSGDVSNEVLQGLVPGLRLVSSNFKSGMTEHLYLQNMQMKGN